MSKKTGLLTVVGVLFLSGLVFANDGGIFPENFKDGFTSFANGQTANTSALPGHYVCQGFMASPNPYGINRMSFFMDVSVDLQIQNIFGDLTGGMQGGHLTTDKYHQIYSILPEKTCDFYAVFVRALKKGGLTLELVNTQWVSQSTIAPNSQIDSLPTQDHGVVFGSSFYANCYK